MANQHQAGTCPICNFTYTQKLSLTLSLAKKDRVYLTQTGIRRLYLT